MIEVVSAWLVENAAVLTVVLTAAWLGVKFFAEKKVEEIFSRRLEAFKAERDAEIIKTKAEFDTALNRARLNQNKEFEIIPSLWENLTEAFLSLRALGPGMFRVPDFGQMDDEQIREFVSGQDWARSTKNEFYGSGKKEVLLLEIYRNDNLSEANIKLLQLERYLLKYGLFLPADIKEMCRDFFKISKSVLVGYRVGDEVSDPEMKARATKEFEDKLQPKFEEVEASLQSLLSYRD